MRMRRFFRFSVRLCTRGLACVGALTFLFAALAMGPLREDVRDAATLLKARLVLRALGEERKASLEAAFLIRDLRWALEEHEPLWGQVARLPISDDAGPAPEPAPDPAATVVMDE